MSRIASATIILITVALTGPKSAHAEQEELAISLGAGLWFASQTIGDLEAQSYAPTVVGAVRYGLDDFWQIGGAMAAGVALSPDHDPAFVGHAHAEAFYFLDIISWVPYATAGVGALVRGQHPDILLGEQDGLAIDLSVHLGGGIDYRPARDWSLGLSLRYEFVLTDLDRTAPALDLALVYTFYLP